MNEFLRHWIVTAIALGATAWILPGVRVDSVLALAVAAVVLGFLNAAVKPVVVLLTLPLTVLTLGIFYLILNGIFFALAAKIVPGFEVEGLLTAILGAIVMGILSALLGGSSVITTRTERH